jgi:protein-S-isoprenylcysteine O-methyltransferase Ste14
MKLFIAFCILFLTHCLSATTISTTVSNTVVLNSITHSKKIDDRRVEKGKKLKGIAAYLLAIAFLCVVVIPKGGISTAQPIILILFFACLLFSLILFLIGLAMQRHWN